jgi:hypothetical protein
MGHREKGVELGRLVRERLVSALRRAILDLPIQILMRTFFRFGTYSTSEAVNVGLDLQMPGPSRWKGSVLVHAISANKVSTEELDARVRAVLKLVKDSATAASCRRFHRPAQESGRRSPIISEQEYCGHRAKC